MSTQESKPAEATSIVQRRVNIEKAVVDTPAILNMVKHCQDSRIVGQPGVTVGGGRGLVMGVLKQELGINSLFVTETQPMGKQPVQTLKQLIDGEIENKNQESNNEIGFYVSCELGLAFTPKNLV